MPKLLTRFQRIIISLFRYCFCCQDVRNSQRFFRQKSICDEDFFWRSFNSDWSPSQTGKANGQQIGTPWQPIAKSWQQGRDGESIFFHFIIIIGYHFASSSSFVIISLHRHHRLSFRFIIIICHYFASSSSFVIISLHHHHLSVCLFVPFFLGNWLQGPSQW